MSTQKKQQNLFNESGEWSLESAVKELLSLHGHNIDALYSGQQWEASEVLALKQTDVNTDQLSIAKKAGEAQAEDKLRVMLEQTFGVPSRREHGELQQVLEGVRAKLSQADPTIQNELYSSRQQIEMYKESLSAKEREIVGVHNQYKVQAWLDEKLSKFKINIPKDWAIKGIYDELQSRFTVAVDSGKPTIKDRATNQIPKNDLGKALSEDDILLGILKDRNLIVDQAPTPKKEVVLPQGQNTTSTQNIVTTQPNPNNLDRSAHLARAQARLAGKL